MDGVYLEPRRYEINLTVGDPIPEQLPPPLKVPPPGVSPPEASIKEFLMNGMMKIVISKPLQFPDGLLDKYNAIKFNKMNIEGDSDATQYIRNMI